MIIWLFPIIIHNEMNYLEKSTMLWLKPFSWPIYHFLLVCLLYLTMPSILSTRKQSLFSKNFLSPTSYISRTDRKHLLYISISNILHRYHKSSTMLLLILHRINHFHLNYFPHWHLSNCYLPLSMQKYYHYQ